MKKIETEREMDINGKRNEIEGKIESDRQVDIRRKEMFYLTMHSTFYLWLYGVRHMVKDHSDSERGNPLLPQWLLFPISSKGSFICIIPQTG